MTLTSSPVFSWFRRRMRPMCVASTATESYSSVASQLYWCADWHPSILKRLNGTHMFAVLAAVLRGLPIMDRWFRTRCWCFGLFFVICRAQSIHRCVRLLLKFVLTLPFCGLTENEPCSTCSETCHVRSLQYLAATFGRDIRWACNSPACDGRHCVFWGWARDICGRESPRRLDCHHSTGSRVSGRSYIKRCQLLVMFDQACI